jgi:hypothetical protein
MKAVKMTIHSSQMEILSRAAREAFNARAVVHLREHFPERAAGAKLAALVEAAVARAETEYLLHGEKDLYAFLNLCGAFGWNFDALPENNWMRATLLDDTITQPSDRVERLVRSCIRRAAIRQRNASLREAFVQQ